MQYSKVLVHAFSVATGRSIAEGLIELGLSDVVQERGNAEFGKNRTLSYDNKPMTCRKS
jgi:hypothetical protein